MFLGKAGNQWGQAGSPPPTEPAPPASVPTRKGRVRMVGNQVTGPFASSVPMRQRSRWLGKTLVLTGTRLHIHNGLHLVWLCYVLIIDNIVK